MSDAPSAKDLKSTKLNKTKTNEASGAPSDEDKKPFKDLWKECGGKFDKVKKHDRFKGMSWRKNFEPTSADSFATGCLTGLAFDD